jgi:tetratricopeptide (TPR) repeat protein
MLETIRDHAREKAIARDPTETVAERLADWAVSLVERAEPHLLRAEVEGWYLRLRLEHANLLAALGWSVENERAEPAIRIAAAIWRFWQREGLVMEGRWWIERLGSIPGLDEQPHRLRGKLASTRGSLAYWAGDAPEARRAYAEARDSYRAAGDDLGIARETLDLAYAHAMTEEYGIARELFEEALVRCRALGDDVGIQDALFMGGYTDMLTGRLDEAEEALAEVLTLLPADSMRRRDAMIGLGQVRRRRGDIAGAREALHAGLSMLGETRDVGTTIGVAEVLGATEVEIGDASTGMRLIAAATALRQLTGTGPPVGLLQLGDPVGRAREILGDEAVDRALAEPRDLDLDALLARVVRVSQASPDLAPSSPSAVPDVGR